MRRGAAWVVPGGLDGTWSVADIATARIVGPGSDKLAGSALAAGDLNGDGVDDLIVDAIGSHSSGTTGLAGIFYGPVAGDVDLSTADTSFASGGSRSRPYALDLYDVDGDGNTDLAAGGNCAVLIFEHLHMGALTSQDVDVSLDFCSYCSEFGTALAIGDLDGDGAADVAVADPSAGDHHPESLLLLLFGRLSGMYGWGDEDVILRCDGYGEAAPSLLAGDFDGAGVDDLAVGAPESNTVYLLLGGSL